MIEEEKVIKFFDNQETGTVWRALSDSERRQWTDKYMASLNNDACSDEDVAKYYYSTSRNTRPWVSLSKAERDYWKIQYEASLKDTSRHYVTNLTPEELEEVANKTHGRLEIVSKADGVQSTLDERGQRYGDFTDHARICQALKTTMYEQGGAYNWRKLSDVQKQALEVIADKIARILNGDPNYADNWHDIQGYARLVEERLPK